MDSNFEKIIWYLCRCIWFVYLQHSRKQTMRVFVYSDVFRIFHFSTQQNYSYFIAIWFFSLKAGMYRSFDKGFIERNQRKMVAGMKRSIYCEQISRMVASDASCDMYPGLTLWGSYHHLIIAGLDIFTSRGRAAGDHMWGMRQCNCKVSRAPPAPCDHSPMWGAPVSAGHSHPRHRPETSSQWPRPEIYTGHGDKMVLLRDYYLGSMYNPQKYIRLMFKFEAPVKVEIGWEF